MALFTVRRHGKQTKKQLMKRTFFLIYGLVAYLIFLATFFYAVGFVSMLFVPKHIDSLPRAPMGYAFLVNTGLLLLFVLQLSFMARAGFKQRWIRIIPEPIERSTYVLLTSLCLILLFWQWKPMGGFIWDIESELAIILLNVLCITGFGVVLVSTFLTNHFDLFGLRQVWFYSKGKKYHSLPFRTPFFYKYVRHPMYLGLMIAFWATPVMTVAHLFLALMMTTYMVTAIRWEEKNLLKNFGKQYLDYKSSAPMLIPFIKVSEESK
jgi:methanethiol S-methyltransferase